MEIKPMTQVALVFSNTLYYTDTLSPSTRSYRLSAQRGLSKTSIHSARSKSDGQQAVGTSKGPPLPIPYRDPSKLKSI